MLPRFNRSVQVRYMCPYGTYHRKIASPLFVGWICPRQLRAWRRLDGLSYYDICEYRLDHSWSEVTLFLKYNEYTMILRGHRLRQLYWSLLLEDVVATPRSDPSAAQSAVAM
jgi:hypothetical protein